ncbi:hypothetical protein JST56_00210 [Candidatus Dependentiae bacterium]|nr:hypothetical protein [Candidatus Dependentiae bacterium]
MSFLKKIASTFLLVVVAFILVQAALLARINLGEIKETYTVLNQNFSYLSPTIGAAWWESGVIHNYYKYGNCIKEKGKPTLGDATIQLIHELFHELAGDLSITTGKYQVASFFSPQIIATILGIIIKGQPKIEDLVIKRKKIINPSNKKKYAAIIIKNIKKAINDHLHDNVSLDKPALNNLTKNITRTANLIVEALDEAYFFYDKESQKYPAITPYAILLAFLYQKANSKKDFFDYFTELRNFLGHSILEKKDDLFNIDTSYESEETIPTNDLIASLSHDIESVQNDRILFEKTIYSLLARQKSRLPKKIRYLTTSFKTLSFANCVEAVIRNIINILLYDLENKTVSLENMNRFHPNIDQENIHPSLKNFLSTQFFQDFNNADKEEVHNAWNNVVQNLSWISYLQIFSENEIVGTKAPENSLGFIWFSDNLGSQIFSQNDLASLFPNALIEEWTKPETLKLTINPNSLQKQVYIVFNRTRYNGCEVAPTLKNIIILLNDLLGLKVFHEEKAQSFIQSDFNKKLFPEICKKFSFSYDQEALSAINIDSIHEEIRIHLSHQGDSFSLMYSPAHSDYYVTPSKIDANQADLDRAIKNITNSIDLDLNVPLLTLLTLLLECKDPSPEQIEEIVTPIEKNISLVRHCFMHLSATELEQKLPILAYLLKENSEKYKLEHFTKRIIETISADVDLLTKTKIVNLFAQSSSAKKWNWAEIMTLQTTFFEKIAQWALTVPEINGDFLRLLSSNDDLSDENPSIDFFNALLAQNQAGIALRIARHALLSNNSTVSNAVLNLYAKFIDQNFEIDQIAQQASQLILMQKSFIRAFGLKIFKALINKNYSIPEALKAATQCLTSQSNDIQDAGLKLFTNFIKKHNNHIEVLEIALHHLESNDQTKQTQGLQIFNLLFENNYGYLTAINLFIKFFTGEEKDKSMIAKSLFSSMTKFIKKKKSVQSVKEEVESLIKDEGIREALRLIKPSPSAKKSYWDILTDTLK